MGIESGAATGNRVLIVIINYNNYPDTRECVASCLASGAGIGDILVVDNGSKPASVDPLDTDFPALKILRLPENMGYSGGANPGFRYSIDNGYDFTFLLNNDLVINPDTVPRLLETFGKFEKVGVAGPLNYSFGDEKVYFSGGTVDYRKGLAVHYSDLTPGPRKTGFITGSAMLIKNSLFGEIGFFDEGYFFYFEDLDFSVRTNRAGYTLVIHPMASVKHKIGGTAGKNPKVFYYFQINRLRFWRKNGPREFLFAFALFFAKELTYLFFQSITNRSASSGRFRYTIWALVDFLRGKEGKSPRV